MFGFIFKKIFGSKNDRYLRRLRPIVARINALEPQMQELADEDFAQRMAEYRQQVQAGERTLDDLLPEVFALVREASRRVMGMRHYDVQLVGGIVLHRGKIAEMKTGEGKTLVATLPVALNALSGKGVHVVTVNDYLATRDAQWMGKLYNFLGLSVGVIVNGLDDQARKEAYGADITYGTNNEFGFDYLRDNMKFYATQLVQRGHNFAIVDEVDSILIDEARTPLIISGASDESVGMYRAMDQIVRQLGPEDYTVDEKARTAMLSEEGVAHCEALLHVDNLFDPANITQQHCILQALKAHHVFKRDVDYIVQNDKVVIVDEFTGRLMDGRRYSDGLHQALEAKENVTIAAENQTLASITFQNYFRMYDKLAGMTGTADTEAVEFHQIYNLEVVSIPPNKPMQRKDYPDLIYRTRKEKYDAIIEAIRELYEKGQPVLVGTISIETSEMLSQRLKKLNIPHSVLNAKQHAREAEIVAQAGQKGHVTIATNMAGRGTDIVLGEGVLELGGLHILGTERHESRRIDNQLRGRAGRQGDPGASRFFLSLEDDLMRIFGGERVQSLMDSLGLEEDVPIENKLITNTIESAQKKLEASNFAIRKQVLQYDDVMNQQREIIYKQRQMVLDGEDISDKLHEMMRQSIDDACTNYLNGETSDDWDFAGLRRHFMNWLCLPSDFNYTKDQLEDLTKEGIADELYKRGMDILTAKEKKYGAKTMRELERICLLRNVDSKWMDHIDNMDQLKQGMGLRGYGQHDPVVEYRIEGFAMFDEMIASIREDAVHMLLTIEIRQQNAEPKREQVAKPTGEGAPTQAGTKGAAPVRVTKIGRNDPCPCGSGLKWKKCTCKEYHPDL
ncbi:MAG: preprotein translocase subunit SecA [Gemmiger sp.]|uniref:preprotein translocase subunit SecA n=1 Tax=Gemmiger sp. TaxID=2049027 RepID=UPI002A90B0E7|nr:preprotein translocase subunit SecA [Gemmiger sp.]MDY5410913.1 preprotein translocase subunit SecA [Gemmiger sp.]